MEKKNVGRPVKQDKVISRSVNLPAEMWTWLEVRANGETVMVALRQVIREAMAETKKGE